MDLATRKYRLIERLINLVSTEKMDKIEAFFDAEIFENENPILTKQEKDLLDERLASHKAKPDAGRNWDDIKADLSKKYAS